MREATKQRHVEPHSRELWRGVRAGEAGQSLPGGLNLDGSGSRSPQPFHARLPSAEGQTTGGSPLPSPARTCAPRERRDSLSSCFPTSSWMSRRRVSREGDSPWEGGRRVTHLPGNSCSETPDRNHTLHVCLARSFPHPDSLVSYVTWTRCAGPPAPSCTNPGAWPRISPWRGPARPQDRPAAPPACMDWSRMSSGSDPPPVTPAPTGDRTALEWGSQRSRVRPRRGTLKHL